MPFWTQDKGNLPLHKKMNEVGESPLTNGSPRPVSQNGPEHMNIGPRGSPPHRPLLGPSQSSQAIWPPVKGLLLGGGRPRKAP